MEAEDTYTPPEATRILRLSRRRVTQMLQAGDLEGTQDTSGRWHIPRGLFMNALRIALPAVALMIAPSGHRRTRRKPRSCGKG